MDAEQIRQLPLEQTEIGMHLAVAVSDQAGRCLVPAGTIITERLLEQLNRHGVTTVTVLVSSSLSEEEKRLRREAITERLTRSFGCSIDKPLMTELYRLVLAYRLTGL